MIRGFILCLVAMGAIAARAESPPNTESGPVRRFALIVGANDGGAGRTRLRYAQSDAQTVAQTFQDLGGLAPSDVVVLEDPSSERLRARFDELGRRVAEARRGGLVQFMFYYSGHSDERALLFGGERLEYRELRTLIEKVPARVHIAVLDSCGSGAFAVMKGGQVRPGFLSGDPSALTGHAFLTSTSAHEMAQESERVHGSFFTHYLVTGLRGAGDANGDGMVTLDEAYRFAFDETLARTEATMGGPQHPAYDIRLAGSGSLVMTMLKAASAELEIEASIVGRVYLRDRRNRLVAELGKPKSDAPVTLGLDAGLYRATVDDGERVWRGAVSINRGHNRLALSQLRLVALEPVARRGPLDDAEIDPIADEEHYRLLPFNIGISPYVAVNAIERRRRVVNKLSLDLLLGRSAQIVGAAVAGGASWVSEDVSGLQVAALGLSYAGGAVSGVQVAGALSLARGNVAGVQLAAVTTTLGDLIGFQFGAVNITKGHLGGMQVGLFNYALGPIAAFQAGFLFGYAPSGYGLQANLVSVARQLAGAQIGGFNITTGRLHGLQFGFFNYADDADVQLGVLSATRRGGVHVDVWTSDVAAFNVSMRLPARYSYSFLNIGVFPGGPGAGWLWGAGVGGHFAVSKRWFVDVDVGMYGLQSGLQGAGKPCFFTQLRLVAGVQLRGRFGLIAGPTFNILPDEELANSRTTPCAPQPGYQFGAASSRGVRFWPGFALGAQL